MLNVFKDFICFNFTEWDVQDVQLVVMVPRKVAVAKVFVALEGATK